MSDNSLHFFINGVDVGKKIKTIPSVLYGVVDVFGQAEEVTITGMGFYYFIPGEVYHWLKVVEKNIMGQVLIISVTTENARGQNRVSREYLRN